MGYGHQSFNVDIAQSVLYTLSQEQYNRYGVQSVQASVHDIHSATCIDLSATFTSKGPNPGQSITLYVQNVTYGTTPGTWCEALGSQGVLPSGVPW